MKNAVNYVLHHLPLIVAAILVAVNYLIDSGSLVLAPHTLDLVNAVLAGAGLGSLHYNHTTGN